MFREERSEPRFEWAMLGDVDAARPNLGPFMPVTVYRLMQFTLRDVLIQEFDVATADRIFFRAGHEAGNRKPDILVSGIGEVQTGTPKPETGNWKPETGIRLGSRHRMGPTMKPETRNQKPRRKFWFRAQGSPKPES